MAKVISRNRSFVARLRTVLREGLATAGLTVQRIETEPIPGTKLHRVVVLSRSFAKLRPRNARTSSGASLEMPSTMMSSSTSVPSTHWRPTSFAARLGKPLDPQVPLGGSHNAKSSLPDRARKPDLF